MKKHLLLEGGVALLILLFLYTALSKLLDYRAFRGQLLLQPFPGWSIDYLLWGLPTVELLACCLLFFGGTRHYGLYLATFLMVLFTGYVALVLARAFDTVPCSCGGVLELLGWETHLVFNIFFLVLAVVGTKLQVKAECGAEQGNNLQGPAAQKGGGVAGA